MEHKELSRIFAKVRNALDRCRARANDADPFIAKPIELAIRVPARVGVVPTTRVKRVSLERLEARNARKLRLLQKSVGKTNVPRPHPVTAIRLDRL